MLDYQDAVQAVWAFGDYFEKRSDHTYSSAGVEVGRVRRLLGKLGSPQQQFSVITVAGTKGKGSTSTMVAHILERAGLRVGLYTQPHLHSYRERIQVNTIPIDPDRFAKLAEEVVDAARATNAELSDGHGLSAYEVGTALAVRHFFEAAVDVSILEVGLGGRLDAVNAVDADLAVITPISRDHVNVLGSRLPQIASEKAGVMRSGRPVVIAPQRESARRELAQRAKSTGARPTWVGAQELPPDRELEMDLASGTQTFRLRTRSRNYGAVRMPLLGPHQRLNAQVATVAVELYLGLNTEKAIVDGLAGVRWPGRFEIARTLPLVILDGAHNDHSAAVLVDSLRELTPESLPAAFVLGLLRDKDIHSILAEFEPVARRYYITASDHPRALSVEDLSTKVGMRSMKEITKTTGIADALDRSIRDSAANDLIVVAGSLSVVAEAREHLGLPFNRP